MSLDDMQFDNDEDRRRYLADLARLKKIREEERIMRERLDSYVRAEEERHSASSNDLDIPNFKRDAYEQEEQDIGSDYREIYISSESRVHSPKASRARQKKGAASATAASHRARSSSQTANIEKRNANSSSAAKPAQKKKKKLALLFQVLLLCIVGFAAYIGFLFLSAKESGYYTVAVFGVDSRDGNLKKGALADVNMLANINKATGEITLVSIYRDNYTEIDGKGTYHKLNEAYFRGGPEQAIAALERNLDIKIDDYATFNWKAVVDTINLLGGVDIEITDAEFKYINGFITETVESTGVGSVHLQSSGMQHLDGVQAVAYARLRLMDTDFNRTERQRKVVSLAFEKAKKADFGTLNHILLTVLPQISTSVGMNDAIPFAKNVSKYHLGDTAGFPFEKTTKVVNKRDYVIPVSLKNNVIALHQFLFGEDFAYTPSAQLKEISAQIIADTGVGNDGEENINVKADDASKQGIGNKSEPKTTAEAQSTANTEAESTTVPESSSSTEAETENKQSETETTEEIINVEENDEWYTTGPENQSGNDEDVGNGPAFNPGTESTPSSESKEQGPGISN